MVLPDQTGRLLRIGGDRRAGVEELHEALLGVVRGPAGVAVGANAVHAARMRADSASASGFGLSPISMAGWPRSRLPKTSGTSRPWQAPRIATHARRGPGQLVDVGTAAGCGLGLGEVEGRHAERPSELTTS